ncbi:MAG TPA: TlpA disulfide reductase family protein [Gallionella sp.]|jgi:peroxiredoxin|nr:TlpA disulfide reductase family protein [Gallionella sp.]
MLKFNSFSFVFALLISCLLLVQGCNQDTVTQKTEMETAPDFDIALFDGGNFQLSNYRGKVIVINFFASWCVSCGEETPVVEKVAHEYSPQTVVFLAIAVDDTEKRAKAFMKKTGLTIPAGLDKTGKIKEAYGLYGMPTTFFIDKNGKISYLHAGVVTEDLLKHEIDKLL